MKHIKVTLSSLVLLFVTFQFASFGEETSGKTSKKTTEFSVDAILQCVEKIEKAEPKTELHKKLYNEMRKLDKLYSNTIKEKLSLEANLTDDKFVAFDKLSNAKERLKYYREKENKIVTLYSRFENAKSKGCVYVNTYPIKNNVSSIQLQEPFIIRVVVYDKTTNVSVDEELASPYLNDFSLWPHFFEMGAFVLGVDENPGSTFPYIYVLYGPAGSGNFGYIYRYEYLDKEKKWNPVLVYKDKITGEDYSIDRKKLILTTPYDVVDLRKQIF